MSVTPWPHHLLSRWQIPHPIVQAPMAGGPATPELVAAASNAGCSLWAGQGAPLVRSGGVAELVAEWSRQAEEVIARLQGGTPH